MTLFDLLAGQTAARLRPFGPTPLLDRLGAAPPEGFAAAIARARSCGTDPAARIARAYRIDGFALDLFGAALAPLRDERLGTLILENAGARRLSVTDVLALAADPDADRLALRREIEASALWNGGLLRRDGDEVDLFERRIDATPILARALTGPAPAGLFHCGGLALRIETADRGRPLFDRIEAQAAALAGRRGRVALAPGPHAATLARALARSRNAALLTATGSGAENGVILAAAWDALAYLVADDDLDFEPPPDLPLPVLVQSQRAGVAAIQAEAPNLRARETAWRRLLGDRPEIPFLALRDLTETATIETAEALLGAPADLAARRDAADPIPVTPLATVSRPSVPWSALILDARPLAQLEDVVRRIRTRARVFEDWGMAPPSGRAVIALLHGEAGTGKTLAVDTVATRLGIPLIRADLSALASKYIGETEKHLAQLFEHAEGFRAVLFFDEADALFARRTGISDSHDRYANIQSNYLLQRLETLSDGIVFLATNLRQNLDEAFTRRIGVAIHLPRPSPAAQYALWLRHLPAAARAPDLALERVVDHHDLTGGEIRNAALSAAFLAADAGEAVGAEHLADAIGRELEKAGRPVPAHRANGAAHETPDRRIQA